MPKVRKSRDNMVTFVD